MSSQQPNSQSELVRKKSSNTGLYAVIAILLIAVVVLAAYFLVLAPPKTITPPPATKACQPFTGQTLQVAGSTFVQPLMAQWETSYGDNSMNYQSVGSGTGITDITTFAVDAGASDAPLSWSQSKLITNPILTMPESVGGAAIIYNLPGNWHAPLNFTGDVLAKIFMGQVTTWNDPALTALNPADSLPATQIVVVHRSDGSGTSYMTQQFLSWDSHGIWNLNYSTTWLGPSTIPGEIGARGSAGVTTAVKSTTGGISYVDLEYALANSVSFGAVENVQGKFIVPQVSNIQSALVDKTSEAGFSLPAGNANTGPNNWSSVQLMNAPGASDYPIASFTYLLFYEHPDTAFPSGSTVMSQAIAESLADFLNWSVSLSGGQQYGPALYYPQLPAFVIKADQQTIGMMTWGGNPVPACMPGTGPSGYHYGESIPSPAGLTEGVARDF